MVCGPDLAGMVFCRNVQGRHAYDIGSLTAADSLKHAGMCTLPEKKHENSIRFHSEMPGVYANGKSEEQIAAERLSSMESWMRELGLVMNLRELGATEEILEGIADGTVIRDGGYKVLNRDEVLEILKASL